MRASILVLALWSVCVCVCWSVVPAAAPRDSRQRRCGGWFNLFAAPESCSRSARRARRARTARRTRARQVTLQCISVVVVARGLCSAATDPCGILMLWFGDLVCGAGGHRLRWTLPDVMLCERLSGPRTGRGRCRLRRQLRLVCQRQALQGDQRLLGRRVSAGARQTRRRRSPHVCGPHVQRWPAERRRGELSLLTCCRLPPPPPP
jgi:hypothetical protein